jgi:hypothetical protein
MVSQWRDAKSDTPDKHDWHDECWVCDAGGFVSTASYYAGGYGGCGEPKWGYYSDYEERVVFVEATHWQPLVRPEPPAKAVPA